MKKELVSIIVPIYKVEEYLNQCIDSIINQTYKKIEIILVDDGSPDMCGQIIDEYAKRDKRVICIHKKNGGLSDARNAGLDIAKGEYITFIDSDDYVSPEFIENLYNCIKKYNVAISQCGIAYVDENNLLKRTEISKKNVVEKNDYLREMYKEEHSTDYVVVWNKMYHKSLYYDLRFPTGKIHEDEFTTYKNIYLQSKIAFVKKALYYYRENSESIMRRKYNMKRLAGLEALEERIIFYQENFEEELKILTQKHYLHLLILNFMNLKKYCKQEIKVMNELVSKFRKTYRNEITFTFKEKVKFIIFYINPYFFYYIFKDKYNI